MPQHPHARIPAPPPIGRRTLSMVRALTPVSNGSSSSMMANTTPATPTLQGIPPELRNKIYECLATTESRKVSGRKFANLRHDAKDGNVWQQFQSSIAVHPLAMTCHQMHTEFGQVLATRTGQTHNLIVENLDQEQLDHFLAFVRTHCFPQRLSDMNLPPLLDEEVTLCLKFSDNVLHTTQTFIAALSRRGTSGLIRHRSLEIVVLPKVDSGSEIMTKAEALLARGALCRTRRNTFDEDRLFGILGSYFDNMITHHWPSTANVPGDAWRSLRTDA